ncbi:MAG: metal-binding protein [Lachnospiraceae bacterium]|nr:metal-binding protein [Lachnospiraceae bacterium]
MKNSYRYFENRDCRYYPCHNETEHLNCLFCYCPLYNMKKCPGNPSYKEKDGKKIKICTDCTFPHKAENYDKIMECLKK